jgi:hypothetical protein
MKIKSRIHFSASVSVFQGVVITPLFYLVLKYVEHTTLPLWLVILQLFLSISLGFILLYALFPLLQRIHNWENKNKAKRKEAH